MREAEQRLGVVDEDLVELGGRQAKPRDIGKGLLVGLVILQHGVVAAGYQEAGAEGRASASASWRSQVRKALILGRSRAPGAVTM
jgi:hypothetical protein